MTAAHDPEPLNHTVKPRNKLPFTPSRHWKVARPHHLIFYVYTFYRCNAKCIIFDTSVFETSTSSVIFLTPLYVYVSLKKRMPNVAKTHIFKLIFIFFISNFSEASMNVPVFLKQMWFFWQLSRGSGFKGLIIFLW